jgi:hypothetical protein
MARTSGSRSADFSLPQGPRSFDRRTALPEDDADEQSFEAADRFASALALCLFAFEVRTRGGVVAGLSGLDAAELGEAAYTFELPSTVSPSVPAP